MLDDRLSRALDDLRRTIAFVTCRYNLRILSKYEFPELSQHVYENLIKMYSVPYPVGTEASWSSWICEARLPEDGSRRRPTYGEAQLRCNALISKGTNEFIKVVKHHKDILKLKKEFKASTYNVGGLDKAPRGWVDNEC